MSSAEKSLKLLLTDWWNKWTGQNYQCICIQMLEVYFFFSFEKAVLWTISCWWIKQVSPPLFSSFLSQVGQPHNLYSLRVHFVLLQVQKQKASWRDSAFILCTYHCRNQSTLVKKDSSIIWSLPDQVRVDSPDPHFSLHLEEWEKLTEITTLETSDCWDVQLVFCFGFAFLCWSGQPHRELAVEGLKSKKEKTRMHIMTQYFLLIFPASLHAHCTLYLGHFISISHKDWILSSPKSSWLRAEFSSLQGRW